MTGAWDFLSELAERALDIEIVLGDDYTVRVVGVGIVTFQRESASFEGHGCFVCSEDEEELDFNVCYGGEGAWRHFLRREGIDTS